MRGLSLVLYTSLALGANLLAVNSLAAEAVAIEDLRAGDMRKLVLHAEPEPVPAAELIDMLDAPRSLAENAGKWQVVNFWATWCAPCRHEMPSLSRLQTAMAGQLEVVTIASGPNPLEKIERFFEDTEIDNLEVLRDPTSAFSRAMGVLGLPVTVVLDPSGREVGRLVGEAEWDSPEALALLRQMAQ